MDLQVAIPFLALFVAIYGVLLQRQQVRLMIGAMPESKRSKALPWWQNKTVLALVVLMLLAWVPFGVTKWEASKVQPATIGVMSWGLINQPDLIYMVNAVILADDPANKLLAIVFHYRGDTDVMDAPNIQRSSLYDVRKGNQILMIRTNDAFRQERPINAGTNHMLFTVPAAFDASQFQTIRQIYLAGGKSLWGGVSPN